MSLPTTATMTGPTTSTQGVPSTNFTITLDQPAPGGGITCMITSSITADIVTTTPAVIPLGQTTVTFTITAIGTGSRNIVLFSTAPPLIQLGSPIVLTAGTGSASGGGIASLTEEQLAVLARRARRQIRDGPTVPGFRARGRR